MADYFSENRGIVFGKIIRNTNENLLLLNWGILFTHFSI